MATGNKSTMTRGEAGSFQHGSHISRWQTDYLLGSSRSYATPNLQPNHVHWAARAVLVEQHPAYPSWASIRDTLNKGRGATVPEIILAINTGQFTNEVNSLRTYSPYELSKIMPNEVLETILPPSILSLGQPQTDVAQAS